MTNKTPVYKFQTLDSEQSTAIIRSHKLIIDALNDEIVALENAVLHLSERVKVLEGQPSTFISNGKNNNNKVKKPQNINT
jgi:hypothetical protein